MSCFYFPLRKQRAKLFLWTSHHLISLEKWLNKTPDWIDQQIKQLFPFAWPFHRSPKHSEVTICKALKQRPANTTLGDFGSFFSCEMFVDFSTRRLSPRKSLHWKNPWTTRKYIDVYASCKRLMHSLFCNQFLQVRFLETNISPLKNGAWKTSGPNCWFHWGPIPLPPWLPPDSSSGLCGVDVGRTVFARGRHVYKDVLTECYTSPCVRLSFGVFHHGLYK